MSRSNAIERSYGLSLIALALFGAQSFAGDIPDLDCVVEPHMIVDLSSQVDGIVEAITVERGDLIEESQVLVELDSGVEKAAVDYARARANATSQLRAGEVTVGFAQRRQERVDSLYQEQAISFDQKDEVETEANLSQLQLDQAEETNRLARLELRRSQETLKRHTIRSPINGVVVQRYLSPGESVKDTPIMRLAQIDPLRVEVIVPVTSFGTIQVGQAAIVRPESPKDGDYMGVVTIVDRVADAASGTFRVGLSLPNPDYNLPSGLKCRVQFLSEREYLAMQAAGKVPKAAALSGEPEPVSDAGSVASKVTQTATAKTVRSMPAQTKSVADPAPPVPKTEGSRRVSANTRVAGATFSRPTAIEKASMDKATIEQAATAVGASACQTVGPIDNASQAAVIKNAIAKNVNQVSVREQKQEKSERYYILSAKYETLEDARELAEKMKSAGLNALYVIGEGKHSNRVSVGVFNKRRFADERQAEVIAAGFDVSLVPDVRRLTRFWLDFEVAADKGSAETLGNALATLLPAASPSNLACDQMVAGRE